MLTLVIGGARSGKSRFAVSQCPRESNVTFVATAFPSDDEMRSRIDRHRRERPSHWKTIECPLALAAAVADHAATSDIVLIDCLTLWLSRLCWDRKDEPLHEIEAFALGEIATLGAGARNGRVVLVTNEVGCGVVPDSAAGRLFQDLQGFANQAAAREADVVYHVVAGIPSLLKPKTTHQEHLA
jgi:adenosylcobinamide kinase/adenosylcobinamide-phosphate guanylyltransferase